MIVRTRRRAKPVDGAAAGERQQPRERGTAGGVPACRLMPHLEVDVARHLLRGLVVAEDAWTTSTTQPAAVTASACEDPTGEYM